VIRARAAAAVTGTGYCYGPGPVTVGDLDDPAPAPGFESRPTGTVTVMVEFKLPCRGSRRVQFGLAIEKRQLNPATRNLKTLDSETQFKLNAGGPLN
jgi:hypothetical protein